jgi:hypothetical protein
VIIEAGDQVEPSAEGLDVPGDGVDGGDLTALDRQGRARYPSPPLTLTAWSGSSSAS